MAVSVRGSRGIAARLETAFVRLNQWVVVAMMGSMATLVFANVVARYLFNYSIIWVEEITQYEMIWITYLGAGLAMREGRHVAVEVVQDRLPAGRRSIVRALVGLTTLGFLLALAVLGFQIAVFAWPHETPVLNLPAGLPYLAIPIGALAFALHLVLVFRDVVAGRFEISRVPDESGGA